MMKVLIFGQIQQEKWPPVGHLGSDQSQVLHTDTFSDCLQVSYSLCVVATTGLLGLIVPVNLYLD